MRSRGELPLGLLRRNALLAAAHSGAFAASVEAGEDTLHGAAGSRATVEEPHSNAVPIRERTRPGGEALPMTGGFGGFNRACGSGHALLQDRRASGSSICSRDARRQDSHPPFQPEQGRLFGEAL
jgi:hypothetical protein